MQRKTVQKHTADICVICGGRLYLVYTRRAGTNDHVFRHRALCL